MHAKRRHQPNEGDGGVEDPNLTQPVRNRAPDHILLFPRQPPDQRRTLDRIFKGKRVGHPLRDLRVDHLGVYCFHLRLEQKLAGDGTDSVADGPQDEEGCRPRPGGGGREGFLESQEGGLEEKAEADGEDELEDDDAQPAVVRGEVDEEAEAEGEEGGATADDDHVASAGLLEVKSDDAVGEGHGAGHDQRPETGLRRRCTEDGLKIARDEVEVRLVCHSVGGAYRERCTDRALTEHSEWEKRMWGDFPFDDDEENEKNDSGGNQSYRSG